MSYYDRDYPRRETALAIIEVMKTADGWPTIGQEIGATAADAQYIAERGFMVYGFPELEPAALAQWTAEVFMRVTHRASSEEIGTVATVAPSNPVDSYGFTPRR